jgi:hypothetical protein
MDGNDKSQERKVGFLCFWVVLGGPFSSLYFLLLLMSFSMLFIRAGQGSAKPAKPPRPASIWPDF